MSKIPATLRLDRLLANLGYGSRKEVQQMAKAGWVTLDGAAITSTDRHVKITPDLPQRLHLQGQPIDPPPGMALMMHKPLGVTCSRKEAGPLVYDFLPLRWRRREPALSTIGRLDKETSGLLLFADDGDLLHRVISPKKHVAKQYVATLDRPLTGEEAALFASGTLMLENDDKPLLPAELEPLTPTTARVTIHEGRYHQVRRMFAAIGNHVAALHRDCIGGLALPADMTPGAYQVLGAAEIDRIFADGSAKKRPDG
jgi:16S rRNA pseudouridine516 synthase